jgi:aspartate/methionine/tyrosine aminotransferase
LLAADIRFIAFEDTGKVWPTQDLKASLIYYSDDIKDIFHEIYNEVYLCVSNFSLGILSAFFKATAKTGLKNTIWDIIDARRVQLRKILENTHLSITNESRDSNLPVEWLNIDAMNKNDFTICQELRQYHLAVLPGRQFYWNSSDDHDHHRNIRISLMKREDVFLSGIDLLRDYCSQFNNEMNNRIKNVKPLHDRAWV